MSGTRGGLLGRGDAVAWLAACVLAAAACGAGGATDAPADTSDPDAVTLDVVDEVATACTIAADCPQQACKLAACLGGTCTTANRPDGTACDDGQACTTGETCQAGLCVPAASTCALSCATDADCPPAVDGDLCKGRARCVEGACRPDLAEPVVCEASLVACRSAECAPATGLCSEQPVANGTPCDDADPCSVTTCVAGECAETGDSPCECRADADCALFDLPCADRHACNTDVFPHVCQALPGSALACVDADPVDCLASACDPVGGVCVDVPVADGSACDDGDPCSETACVAGACEPSGPSACACQVDADCPDDGDACNGAPLCDRSAWPYVCSVDPESVPPACDPSADTFCRHAVCDPATGACELVPRSEALACEPESPCTVDATCREGTCEGSPRDCDDQSPCTDDLCHPVTGACVHTPVVGFVPCEDLAPCLDGGHCSAGLCLGSPRWCDDQNDCTIDSCDKATDACVGQPVTGVSCNDHAPCTQGDTCQAGACVGTPLVCDDASACTVDACDPLTGACTFTPLVGEPCDDGNACTLGDTCDATGACVPASTTTCTYKGMCWRQFCNPAPGNGRCETEPDPEQQGEPCYSFGACGVEARCEKAQCVPTLLAGACCDQAGDCDDGDACTVDECVAHRCEHAVQVCDEAEVGCSFTPCEAGACAAPFDLGSRRVLFDRTPGAATWWSAAYESVEGGFAVVGETLRLSGLVPSAALTLPPVRVPRGRSSLRLRVVEPAEPPGTLGLTASDASVFPPQDLTVRALDLDDQPGFDVLVDLPSTYDRTRRVRLTVTDSGLALGRVQIAHHGGQGCPGNVESPAGFPYQDTLVYASACSRPDGTALVTWVEANTGTEATVAWAIRDRAGAWGPRHAHDEVVTKAGASYRSTCVPTEGGWALAFGLFYVQEASRAYLHRLDTSGNVVSSQPLSSVPDAVAGYPVLADLPAGGFVLAFARDGADGDGWGTVVRAFDDDGTPRGADVLVNQVGDGDQVAPALAVGAERVLVAWETALGVSHVALSRRLFSAGLVPQTPESMFAGSVDVTFRYPSAAAWSDADGEHFLVAYQASGKPVDVDPGRGVYRSEFDGAGVEVVNEVRLSDVIVGDQMVPFASAVPGGVAVAWASNDAGTTDLMLARVDGTGVHPSLRLATGVTGYGAFAPAWPGALEALFWRADGPRFARLGLACDVGLTDCSTPVPGLCVDADVYLPATPACSGEGCTPLCP